MEYPPSGYSSVEFNKVRLNIDNATGLIMNVEKPWYKSLNKIIKKAEKYIQTAIVNFDNKNVVSKHFLSMTGFTEKGLKKLSNL